MKSEEKYLLAVNGGSSSIKLAPYQRENPLKRKLYGKVERIGLSGTTASFFDITRDKQETFFIEASDHSVAALWLIDYLNKQFRSDTIEAIGHRVVSGGQSFTGHKRVTSDLLDKLRRISPFDPDHLPSEIGLMDLFREHFPNVNQFACFDTVFHQQMQQ